MKRFVERTVGEEQELALNAVDPRCGLQRFEQMSQQQLGDRILELFALSKGINITQNGLGGLTYPEGIARHPTTAHGHVTGQGTAVHVFQQQLYRALVIPEKAPLPQGSLFQQQRTQRAGTEVSQIQNLELPNRSEHGSKTCRSHEGSTRVVRRRVILDQFP